MSDKRFVAEQVYVDNEDETEVWDIVLDTENTYAFMVRDIDTASGLCDLLNEQQATINELQDTVYDELEKALKVLGEIYEDYPKDNVHHLHSRLKGLLEEFR